MQRNESFSSYLKDLNLRFMLCMCDSRVLGKYVLEPKMTTIKRLSTADQADLLLR